MSVSWRLSWFESYSEPKVSNDCGQIVFEHHILTLEVPGEFISGQIRYNAGITQNVSSAKPEDSSAKKKENVNLKSKFQQMFSLPVCNGRFGPLSLVAGNVLMQVSQATGHGLCYVTQLTPGHSVTLQVVCQ